MSDTAKLKHHPIIAIAGPTCSGKTALAAALALQVGGEVVNFDSVQIYKGIEIATAKPTEEEKRGLPHHLIDYVDPHVNYTAADWARDAAAKIAEIESRDRRPILVGGTGFYLRSLLRPLFAGPGTDPKLRDRFRQMHKRRGSEFLHRMLCKFDPVMSTEIEPLDHVRIIRSLEIFFQTGRRHSELRHDRPPPPEFADRVKIFVLNPPRDELYEKINHRTIAHFNAGLVQEVKSLRNNGLRDDTNALGAHAYRRVCEYLRGERDLTSAIERSQQDVRNYAKRQLTWFRSEPDAVWIEHFGDSAHAVRQILDSI